MTMPLPEPAPAHAGLPLQAPAPADAELAARARRGDGLAFELIMRRHNRRLFRVARGLVWSDAKAEDVLQEGCVRAYARLGDHGRWASSRVLAASLCAAVARFALLRATLAAAT